MGLAILIVSVCGSLLALWGRRRRWKITARRPSHAGESLSAVARQHLHLLRGGHLSQPALDAAKTEFRQLLEHGQFAQARTCVRPGLDFVVQVRALAEIGTDEAGRVLVHQLERRLSSDPVEQSWYWADVAGGLRELHRPDTLQLLLAKTPEALALPLGHLFAVELVCFDGFAEILETPFTTQGRSAARALLLALEGVRHGIVPAAALVEGQLAELVARLVRDHPRGDDGLITRLVVESLRLGRRAEQFTQCEGDEEAVRDQFQCLRECESDCRDLLDRAALRLPRALADAPYQEHRDILLAIDAIRADAGRVLLGLLGDTAYPYRCEAIRAMAWARDVSVRLQFVDGVRATANRRRWRSGVPAGERVAAILSLRHHPSLDAEQVLMLAATAGDALIRPLALAALGWWEPVLRSEVTGLLRRARDGKDAESRHRARAALARLGERKAIGEMRLALADEDADRRKQAIELVADEGLTWLWPDLERLAGSDDTDVAFRAREAIERLREDATAL